jgi:hypothetical protein
VCSQTPIEVQGVPLPESQQPAGFGQRVVFFYRLFETYFI